MTIRFSPWLFCSMRWNVTCRRCKATPGNACVNPAGWGTKNHQVRIGDSMKAYRAAA